ncbi:hypothetical protein D3C76_1243610 [compost metagenome]
MLGTHRLIVFFILEQGHAEFVADTDHLSDGAFQFQLAFNECRTQFIQARMGQLGDQLRILDQDGDLRLWSQIERMPIPELQSQRQLQALQNRWKLRKHEMSLLFSSDVCRKG